MTWLVSVEVTRVTCSTFKDVTLECNVKIG